MKTDYIYARASKFVDDILDDKDIKNSFLEKIVANLEESILNVGRIFFMPTDVSDNTSPIIEVDYKIIFCTKSVEIIPEIYLALKLNSADGKETFYNINIVTKEIKISDGDAYNDALAIIVNTGIYEEDNTNSLLYSEYTMDDVVISSEFEMFYLVDQVLDAYSEMSAGNYLNTVYKKYAKESISITLGELLDDGIEKLAIMQISIIPFFYRFSIIYNGKDGKVYDNRGHLVPVDKVENIQNLNITSTYYYEMLS